MKAVVGTAGHIDHGKTALVRALTGIDTDRLPEERTRGISIELGFAYLETEDDDRIGIVDVPGHERFIRQMLAGAQGFDYVLVVVAADDGVMPQTEEHFEICRLLGLERGAFVITKADLATAERLEDVRGEIELLAEGTPFAGAPVLTTSAVTGQGIDELRDHLIGALSGIERTAADSGPFRLPVDRAFVLKGHGLVVTGTAADGTVETGDELVLARDGTRVRVREVQVHGRRADRASAGQRIALNLSGAGSEAVHRGDWLVSPSTPPPTRRLEARVEVRPSAKRSLRSHERVRLHLGTSDSFARLVWLGGVQSVEPEQSGFCQLVLSEDAVVAAAGDRFVLRDETATRTLGGGRVLLAQAPKRRARDAEAVAALARFESADPGDRVAAYLEVSRGLTHDRAELGAALAMNPADVEAAVSRHPGIVRVPVGENERLFAARPRYESYVEQVIERVQRHHREAASAPGMEVETLRRDVEPLVELRVFRSLLENLVTEGRLERHGATVSLPGHRACMDPESERLAGRVLADLEAAGSMPPSTGELQARYGISAGAVQEILSVLANREKVVKVATDLYFSRARLDEIESRLRDFLAREGRINPAAFRDLIAASRKFTIPLLDYFDRSGVTVRTGDYRRLS